MDYECQRYRKDKMDYIYNWILNMARDTKGLISIAIPLGLIIITLVIIKIKNRTKEVQKR